MAILSTILDSIPTSFPTGGGASALDSAAEDNFLHTHPWLLFAGVGAACLVFAAFQPHAYSGWRAVRYRRTSPAYRLFMRIILAGLGLAMLVFAVLIAAGLVRM